MAKVDTNRIGLKFADETTEGEAPSSGYNVIEPNEVGAFGASLTTTARSPISTKRQRRKGAVTDLESSAGWTEDITYSAFAALIERALLAKADNREVSDMEPTATVGGTGTSQGYTVPALTAAQAALLHTNSLLWADGFANSVNNGLKVIVTTDPATAATSLRVAGLTAGSTGGFVSLAGYRVPAATSKTWAWSASSKTATLTVSGLGTTLEDGGLAVGQLVHFGSVASVTDDDLQNGIVVSSTSYYGYARVKSIAAGVITFDRVSTALQRTGAADTSNALDMCFGRFIRNVSTADSRYFQQTLAVELESPDLADGTFVEGSGSDITSGDDVNVDDGSIFAADDAVDIAGAFYRVSSVTGNALVVEPDVGSDTDHPTIKDDAPIRPVNDFEYSVGNLVNSLTLNLPLTEKATMGVELVGQDTVAAGQQKGRQGGTGATAGQPRSGDVEPRFTQPFNTSADFARLRVIETDEDGLTTDFKSATLTIANNVSGEKVLGFLGNRFVNLGNLEVTFSGQVVFSSAGVPKAIRDNASLAADLILKNGDGVLGFDLPSVTIGGGGREFPVNQAVLINAEVQSFADPTLDTSIGVSMIPVPLTTSD